MTDSNGEMSSNTGYLDESVKDGITGEYQGDEINVTKSPCINVDEGDEIPSSVEAENPIREEKFEGDTTVNEGTTNSSEYGKKSGNMKRSDDSNKAQTNDEMTAIIGVVEKETGKIPESDDSDLDDRVGYESKAIHNNFVKENGENSQLADMCYKIGNNDEKTEKHTEKLSRDISVGWFCDNIVDNNGETEKENGAIVRFADKCNKDEKTATNAKENDSMEEYGKSNINEDAKLNQDSTSSVSKPVDDNSETINSMDEYGKSNINEDAKLNQDATSFVSKPVDDNSETINSMEEYGKSNINEDAKLNQDATSFVSKPVDDNSATIISMEEYGKSKINEAAKLNQDATSFVSTPVDDNSETIKTIEDLNATEITKETDSSCKSNLQGSSYSNNKNTNERQAQTQLQLSHDQLLLLSTSSVEGEQIPMEHNFNCQKEDSVGSISSDSAFKFEHMPSSETCDEQRRFDTPITIDTIREVSRDINGEYVVSNTVNDNKIVKHTRIVLIGITGCGKSATGNSLLAKKVFKTSAGGTSTTSICQHERRVFEDRILDVVDTPGLYDTDRSEEEVKRELARCICMLSPGPHAFLIIIRVGRFNEQEQKTVHSLISLFGEDGFLKYSIVIVTRKDELEDEEMSLDQFINTSPEPLKKITRQCGGRCFAVNNKLKNDDERDRQTKQLLLFIDNMVEKCGGTCYTHTLFEEVERERKKKLEEEKKRKEEEQRLIIEKQKRERDKKQMMKQLLTKEKELRQKEKEVMRLEKEAIEREMRLKLLDEQIKADREQGKREEVERQRLEWTLQMERDRNRALDKEKSSWCNVM